MKVSGRPWRILHLLSHYKGDYPLFMNLVRGLDTKRFESIICYFDRLSDQPDSLAAEGYPVHFLFERERISGSFRLDVVRRLRSFLMQHPADLIHTQRYGAALYLTLASLGVTSAPILLTVHGCRRFHRVRRKTAGLWLFRRLWRILAVSEAVRQDILKSAWLVAPDKVVTVRNGIDPDPFLSNGISAQEAREYFGLAKDKFLVGTVARLDPVKAQSFLIDAFRVFLNRGNNACLALAGEGRLRRDLEARVLSLGLKDRVTFMGSLREVPRFLRALDLFVLPSDREGLPLALLEAMASGLPVVVTNASSMPEVVERLEGALVVPVRDVHALAVAFERMYRLTKEERSRMGNKNRERVLECFTIERMVKETAAVYEAVLAERSRSWA